MDRFRKPNLRGTNRELATDIQERNTELAYPLQWPIGRPRTKPFDVSYSRFDVTPGKAQNELLDEIERMGGTDIIISTNQRVKRDGTLYAVDLNRTPDDAGVAVYFTRKGDRVCFCCDRYYRPWENMRAIGKTIEAMRGIERWGSAEMLDQAFTGFTALPLPDAMSSSDQAWWTVLEISPDASKDEIYTARAERPRAPMKRRCIGSTSPGTKACGHARLNQNGD